MGPRKFKEMLDQIPRLTPAQKQRLMHGVQTSVRCDELPEPVRQREAELDRLRVCTHCGSSGAVRHGKSAGLCRFRCRSASCGRTFHALTGAPSCWLEAPVEGVGIRSVFASSADAASVSRAMRDRLPNRVLAATSLAWQAAERLETPRHRGDGRDLLSGELQGRSLMNGASPCARARRQSRPPGSGVGPAACLDGSVSRRADLYGRSLIDGGDEHRSGNVGMAGRRWRVCHRWTSQLRHGKPEHERK